MGTVSSLLDRLERKPPKELPPVSVTTFGFSLGSNFISWQTVAEIWVSTSDGAPGARRQLEFAANGLCVSICEGQSGFDQLEAAMTAAFAGTEGWRQLAANDERKLLFRRQ